MQNKNDSKDSKQIKADTKDVRETFQVDERAQKGLVVSEFERAPLTDVNFGF